MTQQITRHELPEWVEPVDVHAALWSQHENVIWLDAGPDADHGFSYIAVGSGPLIRGRDLDVLRSRIPVPSHHVVPEHAASQSPRFNLGFVGWLGYELGTSTTGVELSTAEHEPITLVEVRAALEFDHERRTVALISLTKKDAAVLAAGLTDLGSAQRIPTRPTPTAHSARFRHDDNHYRSMVDACRSAIYRGDAYQLCLTNEIKVDGDWDALDVYRHLRTDNPSHHGALLSLGGVHVLSSSPEVFLRLTSTGRLSTMPIKGTRARGNTPLEDAELVAELLASDKEQAENVMIVDLMRNDLSRVGELGTVAAQNLLEVHTLPHVHQLVSTVSTQLRSGLSAVDAVQATFPAGSMTGAPKIAAMKILSQLENGPRGIYSGAFGWFGLDGACELAMVIRSIVIDAEGASIGAGGGITIDSDPNAELEEMKLKAEPALRALRLV